MNVCNSLPAVVGYKEELTRSMEYLAQDPLVRFVGYGLQKGRALGTLKNVSLDKMPCQGEMPVAEDFMVRFAIGLSMKGLKPVVFLERFDFVPNADDAIINHLDKMYEISRGEFRPTVILRVVVGNREKPLFTGETHTQDLSKFYAGVLSFPVVELKRPETVFIHYKSAHALFGRRSTMLVEYKDLI